MNQTLMVGLLRHGLQLGAGALVARGYLEASMVESVVGAALTLATAGWYVAAGRRR